ncbi:sulfurtransferase complex subunit TusD [Shewanella maritima]|uniref:sulfurtransferase complex subunit TusD n=1 Tax=Shewanella maritima TaxID=2520507 RepID=UPI0037354C91
MNKFIIQVNGANYGSNASFHALQFTQAAISQGHSIVNVFFYQDGVSNANALACPASDEVDVQQLWTELAKQHNFPLTNCVSAALRRGVVSTQDAKENGLSQSNCHEQFIQGGLGELVTGIEQADRLVSF